MAEPAEARLKRLQMRSDRRGTKEMDLILGPFATSQLGAMTAPELDEYELFLNENDQDLYVWISAQAEAPEKWRGLVARIAAFVDERWRHDG